MTQRTPKEIAEGLTEAQRAYLTAQAEWRSPDGYSEKRWMTFPPAATHRVLMRLALVDGCGQIRDLGLSVRQAILEEG